MVHGQTQIKRKIYSSHSSCIPRCYDVPS